MPSPKKGSKSPARRPSRSRKDAVPHVIDYEPESPVIRQQEAEMARRKGYRNALWLIVAIVVVALGKLAWEEAFEKNSRFLLKALDVQTSGPLSVPKLVSATALTLDTNLLTLSLNDVRSRLERLPQVKNVRIQRDYNGSLTIEVKQRLPVAWLECAKQKFYAPLSGTGCLIDAEGVPMPCEVVTKEYLALPVICFDAVSKIEHGKKLTDPLLHTALELAKELNSRAQAPAEIARRLVITNSWSIEAHYATAESEPKVITFGVDDVEMQLERYDRLMKEVRARQWKIATLHFIPEGNTPATFHGTPDVRGLTLAENRPAAPVPTSSTTRR